MTKKPTRTISGVTPLAVMLPPRKCKHGTCVYCPSLNAPQSYTPDSPAVLRARSLNYSPYKQVKSRLESFVAMGHPTNKIELIVMGGTFLSYPLKFQYNFIKLCYDALNEKSSSTLEYAKKLNETSKHRCIALCIETRPDICGEKEIKRMLEFGATRCELGVQIIDDIIYKKINRGHTIQDVILATRRLKDAGFKVGYHLMPNLPGSNPNKDFKAFKKIFSDSNFRPDQIKIYPTQVLPGSKLAEWYKEGKYKPASLEGLTALLIKIKKIVPAYCRIMRIMREIPINYLIAGTKRIDLRKIVAEKMKIAKAKCKCIRCREIGFILRDEKAIGKKLRLHIIKYLASGRKEEFLEIVDEKYNIFALCRVRITKQENKKILLVRELHVYGPQAEIGTIGKVQHKGIGIKLMHEAEKIATKEKCSEVRVISGVGVREYYRKLGYSLNGAYMAKQL